MCLWLTICILCTCICSWTTHYSTRVILAHFMCLWLTFCIAVAGTCSTATHCNTGIILACSVCCWLCGTFPFWPMDAVPHFAVSVSCVAKSCTSAIQGRLTGFAVICITVPEIILEQATAVKAAVICWMKCWRCISDRAVGWNTYCLTKCFFILQTCAARGKI